MDDPDPHRLRGVGWRGESAPGRRRRWLSWAALGSGLLFLVGVTFEAAIHQAVARLWARWWPTEQPITARPAPPPPPPAPPPIAVGVEPSNNGRALVLLVQGTPQPVGMLSLREDDVIELRDPRWEAPRWKLFVRRHPASPRDDPRLVAWAVHREGDVDTPVEGRAGPRWDQTQACGQQCTLEVTEEARRHLVRFEKSGDDDLVVWVTVARRPPE